MTGWEFAVTAAIAIACGGYIGVAWDRYRRRPPPDEYKNRYVSDVRMSRLHVIQDEWLRGPEDRNEQR